MPLGLLCDSANTSRCGCADAYEVAAEDQREVGLRVRGRRPPPSAERARRPPRSRTSPAGRRERADRGIAGGTSARSREGSRAIPLSCLAVTGSGHRVQFSCDGEQVEVDAVPGESLLSVLRERLGVLSVKDGCAPQGQCGCCTVLVDGEPRVACVTPAARVDGRAVTTVDGLDGAVRDDLAARFVASGGSQCGFCTPGILVRVAAAEARGKTRRVDLDRALAAHLCRCTGWQTVYEAIEGAPTRGARRTRRSTPPPRRAELEGGARQRVGPGVPLGDGGFADDAAPRDALVAVPSPARLPRPGHERAAAWTWVVAETAVGGAGARGQGAGSAHDRRSRAAARAPGGGARRRAPRHGLGRARLPRARRVLVRARRRARDAARQRRRLRRQGGVAGAGRGPRARRRHRSPGARRVLARRRRAPRAEAAADRRGGAGGTTARCVVHGSVAGDIAPFVAPVAWPYDLEERGDWASHPVIGPPTSSAPRAVGLAERAVLLEGALHAAGVDRAIAPASTLAPRGVCSTSCVAAPSGALAGARVDVRRRRADRRGARARRRR